MDDKSEYDSHANIPLSSDSSTAPRFRLAEQISEDEDFGSVQVISVESAQEIMTEQRMEIIQSISLVH